MLVVTAVNPPSATLQSGPREEQAERRTSRSNILSVDGKARSDGDGDSVSEGRVDER